MTLKVNKEILEDALYDIDPGEVVHFPEEEQVEYDHYGRGLIVGLVYGLAAAGLSTQQALEKVRECIEYRIRRGAVPYIFKDMLSDYAVDPPVDGLQPVLKFLQEQDCELEYPNGPEILFTTPNSLSGCVKVLPDGKYQETIDGDVTVFDNFEDLKAAWLEGQV